jgi:selenocysteine lyase/cysteine desulfurase
MSLDIDAVRSKFTALQQGQVFMDNAGGSQVLDSVIDSISTYLKSTNVQLGATYAVGLESTRGVNEGYAAAAKYINANQSDIGKWIVPICEQD